MRFLKASVYGVGSVVCLVPPLLTELTEVSVAAGSTLLVTGLGIGATTLYQLVRGMDERAEKRRRAERNR